MSENSMGNNTSNNNVETGFDKELNDKQYMDDFFKDTSFGGLVYGQDPKKTSGSSAAAAGTNGVAPGNANFARPGSPTGMAQADSNNASLGGANCVHGGAYAGGIGANEVSEVVKAAAVAANSVDVSIKHECSIVSDLLGEYIDNSCSPYTRDFVSRHLEQCPNCKRTVLNMQQEVNISAVTDAEATLNVLKKAMGKKMRKTIALLTTFFTLVACVLCFWFIAKTVRLDADADYHEQYNMAIAVYEKERAEGNTDPIDKLAEKVWKLVERDKLEHPDLYR